jgi:hypothetical protein
VVLHGMIVPLPSGHEDERWDCRLPTMMTGMMTLGVLADDITGRAKIVTADACYL